MSAYLGFQPTKNPIYYFVSYNNEDADRVGEIARTMSYSGINLWYDHGIEYGDDWETVITEKIRNAEAVILFFTRGILQKSNSYVRKEYKIATEFYGKKVYIVMLDEIKNADVPVEKVAWWIDINEKQCVDGYKYGDPARLVEDIALSLGIQSHEDKMNRIIAHYNELYSDGRITEADACISEYLRGVSLLGKVRLIKNILNGKLQNTTLASSQMTFTGRLEEPLYTHTKRPIYSFYECKRILVGEELFTVGNEFLFHRGDKGDAHIIMIWRNDELIHTVSSLVDAYNLNLFLDEGDGILYVAYTSDEELFEDGVYVGSRTRTGITTVELRDDGIICTDFKYTE